MSKGKCKNLDYMNNLCLLTGKQCVGAQECEDFEEQES
jgi:hypothetical protein